jgi:hypothetical protein
MCKYRNWTLILEYDTSNEPGSQKQLNNFNSGYSIKWDVEVWTGLSWLRIETGGRNL